MRVCVAVASLAWLAAVAMAQSRGSIEGTVFDPDGKIVDSAPVQARNPETGATLRSVSAANGSYSLAQAALGPAVAVRLTYLGSASHEVTLGVR